MFFSERMLQEAGEGWAVGEKQIALKEWFFFVTGVYIHAVTPQDVRSRRDPTDLWVYGDEWYGDVEMSLDDLPKWSEIVEANLR